jgi:23S rRNA (uracil1939-C5)-methyltransferase
MKRLSEKNQTLITAYIEKSSHDGRGIARIDGKTTFVEGALPEEEVSFILTKQKKDYNEGRVVSIVKASPHRVDPACLHFSVCGGCSMQHLNVKEQIQEKQKQMLDMLSRIGNCSPESILPPLVAKTWQYRTKARLSVRFVQKKNTALVGFREKNNPRYIAEVTACAILTDKLACSIHDLRELINTLDNPSCIAQIEVAVGNEAALIVRNLEILSADDENKLKQFAQKFQLKMFLQPKGPSSIYLLYPQDGISYLHYDLPEHSIRFQFHPSDFTQINDSLNPLMVSKALELLDLNSSDTVLDLFCGLGNFTLPIANYCKSVVGVEGSEMMIERAKENAKLNQIENSEFFAANLEEGTILDRLGDYQFTKVLLDPPRTGAQCMVQLMDKLKPKTIVYISCNPATLARDSNILVNQKGYRLMAAGVMDMFPHTAHVESIAVFERVSKVQII